MEGPGPRGVASSLPTSGPRWAYGADGSVTPHTFHVPSRQAIRCGTFTSVRHLIFKIRDYVAYWNADAPPFEWTATPEEIIVKVAILQRVSSRNYSPTTPSKRSQLRDTSAN